MQVGCLEKNLPMKLELVDKEAGVYNFYAPGQIDIDFILNTLKNPPADCRYLTVFSEDGDRDLECLLKYFEAKGKEYQPNARWFRFERNGFVHFMIDLYNGITDDMLEKE